MDKVPSRSRPPSQQSIYIRIQTINTYVFNNRNNTTDIRFSKMRDGNGAKNRHRQWAHIYEFLFDFAVTIVFVFLFFDVDCRLTNKRDEIS